MLSSRTLINLSKYIENILFNQTQKDEYGFVLLEKVLDELRKHPLWDCIEFEDIVEVVNSSSLKRLQIMGNKIRMVQTPNIINITSPITNKKVIPPKLLYYGTSLVGITRIKTFGIKSFKDNYIKLYPDKKMVQVLVHRNADITYIEINALDAHLEGVTFIKGDYNSYLTEFIAPKYIQKII